jgi:hypothetical protein
MMYNVHSAAMVFLRWMEIVQEGCCVACGSLLMEKMMWCTYSFVLWWGVILGREGHWLRFHWGSFRQVSVVWV